ncbi:MAG: zf-HC2 domain-containing protein [Cyclobacteriaceae bacterium]|nr:zf-HC2 domain-containing protein [Cyclobacteriaceae bacterium]
MKCKEAEQLIYLYSELDMDEKRLLDAHVASCQQCGLIATSFGLFGEMLMKARTHEPAPANAAQLTSRIMEQVHSGSYTSRKNHGLMLPAYWFRVAITITSLILAIAFGIESSVDAYKVSQQQWEVSAPATQAHPSQYWQARTQRNKPASLYQQYRKGNAIRSNETKTIYTDEQI